MNNFKKFIQDKDLSKMTNKEIYDLLLNFIKKEADKMPANNSKRKIYYISAEFLIGKLLSNNLINLGIYEDVKKLLNEVGKNLCEIEELEEEPSLGNGGLGRLASCFIDSMSTLGINGEGIGLNYHCGLFKQVFVDNQQNAEPNFWIDENSWLNSTDIGYSVEFKNFILNSKLYQIDVLGYEKETSNNLNLFDINSIDYKLIEEGIEFDKTKIKNNLTLFLYPDDSDKNGELLRIYQQYFMVSNAAQYIIDETIKRGGSVEEIDKYAFVQINDTHPSLVIPEFIRILTEKYKMPFKKAVNIVTTMTGYTNHTILAEALEKWPLEYLDDVVPKMVVIIKKLDKIIKNKFKNEKLWIIDKDEKVHMANMDIHFSSSVNGVAELHTEILKNSELNDFYKIYPEKFNNKTNGITFRRWLNSCNPNLAKYLESLVGDYNFDVSKLENLLEYENDEKVYHEIEKIKKQNKIQLKKWLKSQKGINLNENSIIDTQIKRFHEYKRQQMNALYVIYKYLEIKRGKIPSKSITIIFGGKAAPAYTIAQDIIHLILCLSELINNDPEVNKYLNVYLIENYNVTAAEKLIPATDISEQISLASKEASGTGNMKFMINGAITLGTLDGANVEIAELVGKENIYIFGKKADEIISLYENKGYSSKKYYQSDSTIKEVVDFIISDKLIKLGNKERLNRLYNELISKDWFMTLIDLIEYINVKESVFEDYMDRNNWNKKVINNIAKAGFFSSDRTIKQYNDEIWKII